MKTILCFLFSLGIFLQVAMLVNAGVLFLLYFILRLFHVSKTQILSWYNRYPKTALFITSLVAESSTLIILLPICREWFGFIGYKLEDETLLLFALLEILPSFYKFHKVKAFIDWAYLTFIAGSFNAKNESYGNTLGYMFMKEQKKTSYDVFLAAN